MKTKYRKKRVLSEDDVRKLCAPAAGYCVSCDAVLADGVEPTAWGSACALCGSPGVMGAERAILAGFVRLPKPEEVVGDG